MHQFEYLKVVVCPQAVSTPSLMVPRPQPECGCWLLSVSVRGEEGRYYLLLASHPTTSHTTQLHTDMETRLDNHPIFAVLVPACMEESAHCATAHTAQAAGTRSNYTYTFYCIYCILINL